MQRRHERVVLAPPQAAACPLDPWLELEGIIQRLARLVLNGQALADRKAAELHDPARLWRLRAGVQLGQRAIAAAVAVDVDPEPKPSARSRGAFGWRPAL